MSDLITQREALEYSKVLLRVLSSCLVALMKAVSEGKGSCRLSNFFGGSLTKLFSSFLPLSFCHRTNSDSALHTSAMSPNPQDPFGKNQQMGRGPPQRNGELGPPPTIL